MFSEDHTHLLNRAICEHLLREGQMDIAETLIKVGSHVTYVDLSCDI